MNKKFGGEWTKEKLDILRKYLDAYTTALKDKPHPNRPFELVYIDAFAGTGKIRLKDTNYSGQVGEFIQGSIELALDIEDKSFDKFYFIEKDEKRCQALEAMSEGHLKRNKISIYNGDANDFLKTEIQLEMDENHRGVLFLDPFATEVEWESVKAIAASEALDAWILFPSSAIARLLPTTKKPEDVSATWKRKLDKIFGGDHWEGLYSNPTQTPLFGESRDSGVEGLIEIYKKNLRDLLGKRFLDKSATLRGPKRTPLFEFMFFTGNPKSNAITLSHRIANHILEGYKA